DSDNRHAVQVNRTALRKLDAFDPQGIFVARGQLFARWEDPFTATSPFANPRLIPLGWTTNSPLLAERLARLGISDLYSALRARRHVYLVGDETLTDQV